MYTSFPAPAVPAVTNQRQPEQFVTVSAPEQFLVTAVTTVPVPVPKPQTCSTLVQAKTITIPNPTP